MKTGILVQARMTSERLPGKVLKPILGKPLLEYEIERLRRVRGVDTVIVATSTNRADDAIASLCARLGVECFRGSETDVLGRFYGAAEASKLDTVVRVCGDCPLIDPGVIEKVLNFYLENRARYDYASNIIERSYPRGLDCEAFSFEALAQAHREAKEPRDREHVTPFIYSQPGRYRIGVVKESSDQSDHRWTVDTSEDFTLVENILNSLYPKDPFFTWHDVLGRLAAHPEWRNINSHISQKKVI